MPDPTKATLSATQTPGLFGVSPWVTRWMLYQQFANNVLMDSVADERMNWGLKMQPLIIDQAANDLRLEARPNDGDDYVRFGRLGCTRDAEIICPDRGPGALETKCVFDYRTWMEHWQGGKFVPRHYEIQLQQQMLVGDGTDPYAWGVLAAWVAGEVYYFERAPIRELWATLEDEAEKFFADVRDKREPDPFGAPVELPWLSTLFPTHKGNTAVIEDEALSHIAIAYRDAKEQEAGGKRTAEPLRAKLLAAAKDHDELSLPGGVIVRITPLFKGKRIKVFVPDIAASGPDRSGDYLYAG